MTRRSEIEEFCRQFLRGNIDYLNNIISQSKNILLQIDLEKLNISKDTLDVVFKNICERLFTLRSIENAYIIAVLGFAMEIHIYHHASSWYSTDLLVASLTNVLVIIDFNPIQLTTSANFCLLL